MSTNAVAAAVNSRAFDRLVVRSLPYVPKRVFQRVARRYLAGETLDDVTRTVVSLGNEGAMATVDLLGEDVTDAGRASAYTHQYIALLEHIAQEGLDANISVKLTMLGLRVDETLCQRNLARIAGRARAVGKRVRIDMEDHSCTDPTLRIYRRLQPELGNIGLVLQAMLRRTSGDVDQLLAADGGERPLCVNVRLVKGIYIEPPEIAFQSADEIRDSYLACLERLLQSACYVAIATHDQRLLDRALTMVKRLGLSPEQYEIQMLLGVLPDVRRALIASGHRVRVYVPYGADWYAYSLRRLRENPNLARHLMRAIFRRAR